MSECDRYRQDLGAYVLEGLAPADAHAVEAHLEQCTACRTEHAELAGTPTLLGLARSAPPRVPERVRDRVVASAVRARARRRWAGLTAAAAVVAAVVGGLVGWQLAPAPTPEVAVALEDVEPFEASGWATFSPRDGSLLVRIEVEGLEPLEQPGAYEAWLYTADSRIMSIGQLSDDGDTVTVELTVDGSLEDFKRFWITAEPDARDPAHEGPTVLQAAVPELR